MYKLSTYFYWFIIIVLRIIFAIEYSILRVIRWPVTSLAKIALLKKFQIRLIFEDEKELPSPAAADKIGLYDDNANGKLDIKKVLAAPTTPTTNRPILTLKMKNKNIFLKFLTYGSLPYLEGIANGDINGDSIETITVRTLNNFLNNPNPLFRIREWIYLNATECPWDKHDQIQNILSKDWMDSKAKSVFYEMMGGELNCVSGYWDQPGLTVPTAIDRNMENIAKKLNLKPGMKILDLGCGTGIFANYLANNYNVSVIGINFSQVELNEADQSNPKVKFLCGDYKMLLEDPTYLGYFDRVVTIHLLDVMGGPRVHSDYFNALYQYVKPGVGQVFIQTIIYTRPIPIRCDLFVRKYLVPLSCFTLHTELINGLGWGNRFVISNIESTGEYYGKTIGEYAKFLKSIPGDGFLKKAWETLYSTTEIMYKLKILDVWQVCATRRFDEHTQYISE